MLSLKNEGSELTLLLIAWLWKTLEVSFSVKEHILSHLVITTSGFMPVVYSMKVNGVTTYFCITSFCCLVPAPLHFIRETLRHEADGVGCHHKDHTVGLVFQRGVGAVSALVRKYPSSC